MVTNLKLKQQKRREFVSHLTTVGRRINALWAACPFNVPQEPEQGHLIWLGSDVDLNKLTDKHHSTSENEANLNLIVKDGYAGNTTEIT